MSTTASFLPGAVQRKKNALLLIQAGRYLLDRLPAYTPLATAAIVVAAHRGGRHCARTGKAYMQEDTRHGGVEAVHNVPEQVQHTCRKTPGMEGGLPVQRGQADAVPCGGICQPPVPPAMPKRDCCCKCAQVRVPKQAGRFAGAREVFACIPRTHSGSVQQGACKARNTCT